VRDAVKLPLPEDLPFPGAVIDTAAPQNDVEEAAPVEETAATEAPAEEAAAPEAAAETPAPEADAPEADAAAPEAGNDENKEG